MDTDIQINIECRFVDNSQLNDSLGETFKLFIEHQIRKLYPESLKLQLCLLCGPGGDLPHPVRLHAEELQQGRGAAEAGPGHQQVPGVRWPRGDGRAQPGDGHHDGDAEVRRQGLHGRGRGRGHAQDQSERSPQ